MEPSASAPAFMSTVTMRSRSDWGMVSSNLSPADLNAAFAPSTSRVSFMTPLPMCSFAQEFALLPRTRILHATCSLPAEVVATLE